MSCRFLRARDYPFDHARDYVRLSVRREGKEQEEEEERERSFSGSSGNIVPFVRDFLFPIRNLICTSDEGDTASFQRDLSPSRDIHAAPSDDISAYSGQRASSSVPQTFA